MLFCGEANRAQYGDGRVLLFPRAGFPQRFLSSASSSYYSLNRQQAIPLLRDPYEITRDSLFGRALDQHVSVCSSLENAGYTRILPQPEMFLNPRMAIGEILAVHVSEAAEIGVHD